MKLALLILCLVFFVSGCNRIDFIEAQIKAGKLTEVQPLLENLARSGDGRAQRMLMNLIRMGRIPANEEFSYEGLLDASLRQGVLSHEGRSFLVETEQNRLILKYYAQAREGDPQACLALGYFFFAGEGVFKDDHRSIYWTARAAETKNPDILLEVGSRFFEGVSAPKDTKKALHYWGEAAKLGHEKAKNLLLITSKP